MRSSASQHRQRGMMTLFVAMIMLLLITGMVVTAFTLSTTNLRSVGNMQVRNEAIAAANAAIGMEVGSPFTDAPAAVSDRPVDIDEDGTADYLVDIALPTCVRAYSAALASSSSVTLPGMSSIASWNTVWEFVAVVTDPRSGAEVRVREGVRVLLTNAQKVDVCN